MVFFRLSVVERRQVGSFVFTGFGFLCKQRNDVAAPQVPVLFVVVDLLVARFVVLPIDYVGEGSTDPHV